METIEILVDYLEDAKRQIPADTVETAISIYHRASAVIDAYTAVKDAAKKLIGDVMEETGVTKYETSAGSVNVTAPSFVISYDAKALDILTKADAELAALLYPYRKETIRTGTMRITAKK